MDNNNNNDAPGGGYEPLPPPHQYHPPPPPHHQQQQQQQQPDGTVGQMTQHPHSHSHHPPLPHHQPYGYPPNYNYHSAVAVGYHQNYANYPPPPGPPPPGHGGGTTGNTHQGVGGSSGSGQQTSSQHGAPPPPPPPHHPHGTTTHPHHQYHPAYHHHHHPAPPNHFYQYDPNAVAYSYPPPAPPPANANAVAVPPGTGTTPAPPTDTAADTASSPGGGQVVEPMAMAVVVPHHGYPLADLQQEQQQQGTTPTTAQAPPPPQQQMMVPQTNPNASGSVYDPTPIVVPAQQQPQQQTQQQQQLVHQQQQQQMAKESTIPTIPAIDPTSLVTTAKDAAPAAAIAQQAAIAIATTTGGNGAGEATNEHHATATALAATSTSSTSVSVSGTSMTNTNTARAATEEEDEDDVRTTPMRVNVVQVTMANQLPFTGVTGQSVVVNHHNLDQVMMIEGGFRKAAAAVVAAVVEEDGGGGATTASREMNAQGVATFGTNGMEEEEDRDVYPPMKEMESTKQSSSSAAAAAAIDNNNHNESDSDANTFPFASILNLLEQYKKEHGHVNIPQQTNAATATCTFHKILNQLLTNNIEDIADTHWEMHYTKLMEYKSRTGDVDVPYTDDTLGVWLERQREIFVKCGFTDEKKKKTKMKTPTAANNQQHQAATATTTNDDDKKSIKDTRNAMRFHQLQSQGFTIAQSPWNNRLSQLISYQAKYKHVSPPIINNNKQQQQQEVKDTNENVEMIDEYPGLGIWVINQRFNIKNMPKERSIALDKLGFVWNHNRKNRCQGAWDRRYEELLEYQKQNGHCNVPATYRHSPLGTWVGKQREEYKKLKDKKSSQLDKYRVDKLTKIKFQWSLQAWKTISWDDRYHKLKQFKERHGHCRVPRGHADFGNWPVYQKTQYKLYKDGKKSKITKEKVERLIDIGFLECNTNNNEGMSLNNTDTLMIEAAGATTNEQQAAAAASTDASETAGVAKSPSGGGGGYDAASYDWNPPSATNSKQQ